MLKICLGFLNDRSIMTTNQNYFIVLLREHNTYSNYQATLILIIFAFALTICLHKPCDLDLFRLIIIMIIPIFCVPLNGDEFEAASKWYETVDFM